MNCNSVKSLKLLFSIFNKMSYCTQCHNLRRNRLLSLFGQCSFCGRHHRSSSHRRSTVHCSICLVLFPRTPGLHSLITLHMYSLCSPHVFVWNCLFCYMFSVLHQAGYFPPGYSCVTHRRLDYYVCFLWLFFAQFSFAFWLEVWRSCVRSLCSCPIKSAPAHNSQLSCTWLQTPVAHNWHSVFFVLDWTAECKIEQGWNEN